MELGEVGSGCVHCGASHTCVEERIISLLTEIRDNQRTQTSAPPADAGVDVIGSVAAELNAAAQALEASAKQLKEDGKGWRAGQAMQAAMRARAAAQDLSGA